jgi:hypothetical protein
MKFSYALELTNIELAIENTSFIPKRFTDNEFVLLIEVVPD